MRTRAYEPIDWRSSLDEDRKGEFLKSPPGQTKRRFPTVKVMRSHGSIQEGSR